MTASWFGCASSTPARSGWNGWRAAAVSCPAPHSPLPSAAGHHATCQGLNPMTKLTLLLTAALLSASAALAQAPRDRSAAGSNAEQQNRGASQTNSSGGGNGAGGGGSN